MRQNREDTETKQRGYKPRVIRATRRDGVLDFSFSFLARRLLVDGVAGVSLCSFSGVLPANRNKYLSVTKRNK